MQNTNLFVFYFLIFLPIFLIDFSFTFFIKNEGKNSIYLYTAWGGTNQELQSTDILKKVADTMRKIEYKGRFEIGATIGSHSGPVFGIGIISKIR